MKKIKKTKKKLPLAILSLFTFAMAVSYTAPVIADHLEAQIRNLQQENVANRQASNDLAAQADSYEDAVNKLQTQINSIQAAIVANQQESARLEAQIVEQQKELDHQKQVLGQNIKTMYLEGQISTLEILASSKDLSEFVTKEQYRSAVQNQIKTTVDKINELKQQLQTKREQVESLIKAQEAQRAEVASKRNEQAALLAYTEAQKSSFDAKIRTNQAQIADLRRQQLAENARLSGGVIGGRPCDSGNGDTYPYKWCSIPRDAVVDTWGMYNRECVSYTAWKVYESGRFMPYWGGRGDAKKWDDNARAAGIPVDTSPRPGDVAVSNSGTWGHTMYVEAVNSDGSIYVSDYNQQLDGAYRSYTISRSTINARSLVFIHF